LLVEPKERKGRKKSRKEGQMAWRCSLGTMRAHDRSLLSRA
jgi:hypothetical protein